MDETELVRQRYRRRKGEAEEMWSGFAPSVYLPVQEKERALIRWIRHSGMEPVETRSLLEVGCGTGDDLLLLIRLGFDPGKLVGSELLEERVRRARHRLPAALRLDHGDAAELDLADAAFDVVMQSTVFTSLLDDGFQRRLADRMWALTKPGGGVLWIDFVYNNPRNPDVRGIPLARVQELFPEAELRHWRISLAPPISRLVTRVHPSLYGLFNSIPVLRTHVLCWLAKGSSEAPRPPDAVS
jgi:ubiquinone/menaquinone biosynthesis C-methylase UbiE